MKDYLERDDFARAITLGLGSSDTNPALWLPWAYFRLGMYKSVVASVPDLKDASCLERQLLPVLVSMAACGEHDQVRRILNDLSLDMINDRLWVAIAKHLSIYMPDSAMQLMSHARDAASPAETALILLRAGQADDALAVVDSAMTAGGKGIDPDLQLLRLACREFPSELQLRGLNSVFENARLARLSLISVDTAAWPGNLRVADDLAPVEGPLVTVIMTAFNASERISYAIESILSQTYKNLELIVVDDCSSDGTWDVVRRIAARDPRVRLLRLSHNVGTYYAKTVGAQHAQGEFLTCMDSDDWSHPEKIALQVQPLLLDDKLVATASSGVRICDDGTFDVTYTVSAKLIRLSYPSLLFRREVVQKAAGLWDSAARINADVEFLARMKLHFGPEAIQVSPQPLSVMSRNGSSLTGNASSSGFGKRQFPKIRLDYVESFNRWHMECLRIGSLPIVEDCPVEWLNHHPFDIPSEMRVGIECASNLVVMDA